jgi:cadmium resistance protein CadD (predicted permease)
VFGDTIQIINFKNNIDFKFKMGLVATFTLFVIGFVAFFATGIDDTVAYASSYLENKRKDHKKLISLGIIIGTFIALAIAIFAGSLMASVPSKHLIGGFVLITLGTLSFFRGKGVQKQKKVHFTKVKEKLKYSKPTHENSLKFIGLGMVLFFATGIDDIIAYSNLIMAKGSWVVICLGVIVATFVSLIIAHSLEEKLKKFSHPERIGGTMMIIIGILLALKIL